MAMVIAHQIAERLSALWQRCNRSEVAMLFIDLRGMAQAERPSAIAERSRKFIWLVGGGVLPLLGILLSSILLNADALTVGNSVGPQWVQVDLPSLPALARHKAVVVEIESGETLCAIGGDSKQVYCYPLGTTGMPDDVGGGLACSLGEALRYHAATTVDSRIYVLGGKVGSGRARQDVYCMQRDSYSHKWVPKSGGVMRKKVMQPAAVTVGNRIYVVGGCDDGWNYLADVWSTDVGAGCIVLGEHDWQQEASLRTSSGNLHKVSGHAAVSVELNGKNYIYVIGGITSSGSPSNTVLRAKVRSNGKIDNWDDLGSVRDMPGKWLLTAAVSGRYLYVLGGTTSPTASTSSAEVYRARIEDNGDLTWLSRPRDLPVSLHAHATAVSKPGRLYVVGGISNEVVQDKVYFTPLLDFDKLATPDGPVTYGDTITYTLKLTNLGVRDFETLDITDTVKTNVPTSLKFDLSGLDSDPSTNCREYTDNVITCTISDLGIGKTTDLGFAVTISQPPPALHSAVATSQVPLAASTSPTKTWEEPCSAARLEVVGVGLSDSSTLPISNPETIVGDVRVQAAFRLYGGELDDVIFYSGGVPYPPIEPPSADDPSIVYERDVPASDVVSVTFKSVGDVKVDALTAFFLRSVSQRLSLAGHTMNQVAYHSALTDVLKLPLPARSGKVTVTAVVADNDPDDRVVRLLAQAGGVSRTVAFTEPNRGNYLDIRELQLSGIPTTTREIIVVAESPSEGGESLSLIGLVAETECTPLRVSNTATVCENVDTGSWCWGDIYINADGIYLPIVLKDGL